MSLQSVKERLGMTSSSSASANATHAKEDVKHAAHDIKEAGKAVVGDAARKAQATAQSIEKAADDAAYQRAKDNDLFRAPIFSDIGGEYDATFAQKVLSTKRLNLCTPNLLTGTALGDTGATLKMTSVHESDNEATPGTGKHEEQITESFAWSRVFGPSVAHTPTVKDSKGNPMAIGFELNRPVRLGLSSYVSIPVKASNVPATWRLSSSVTDVKSGLSTEFSSRMSGLQYRYAIMTRSKYATVGASFTQGAKDEKQQLSGSLGATLYRDPVRNSSLVTGVQVTSAPYSAVSSMLPSAITTVTARAEYDEPRINFDARITASSYKHAISGQNNMKLSDATIRALYLFRVGKYPRLGVGASVGLVDGGESVAADGARIDDSEFEAHDDPDASVSWKEGLTGQLTNPVASASLYYQLNPNNKLKARFSSNRQLTTTYDYALTPSISLTSCFQAFFPQFDIVQWAKQPSAAGVGMKTKLGFGLTIAAQ